MGNWKALLSDVSEVLRSNTRVRTFLIAGMATLVGWAVVSQATGLGSSQGQAAPSEAATTQSVASDAQRSAVEGYGDAESKLVATLDSFSWVSSDGQTRLTFDGDEYARGSDDPRAFAVTSVSASAPVASTVTDNETVDSTTTETTFSVLLDDGATAIETLTEASADGRVTRTLAGDAFDGSWVAESPSDDLVVDHDDHLSRLIDGHEDELREALWNWSQANAPSASRAMWLGTARIDDGNGRVLLDISLNDVASTRVRATYSTSNGDFTIARAD